MNSHPAILILIFTCG